MIYMLKFIDGVLMFELDKLRVTSSTNPKIKLSDDYVMFGNVVLPHKEFIHEMIYCLAALSKTDIEIFELELIMKNKVINLTETSLNKMLEVLEAHINN